MTRSVLAVAPDTSLETAARLFSVRRISGAPVIDAQGRAIGVITQSDLLDPDRGRSGEVGRSVYYRIGNSAHELSFEDVAIGQGVVADLMSPFVLSIEAEAPIEDAARIMLLDKVHRLLVLEGERVIGIITTTDMLRAFARRRARAA